jgi:hypothetical protein
MLLVGLIKSEILDVGYRSRLLCFALFKVAQLARQHSHSVVLFNLLLSSSLHRYVSFSQALAIGGGTSLGLEISPS